MSDHAGFQLKGLMKMPVDMSKCKKVKIEHAITPPLCGGAFDITVNCWWITDGEHIFFYKGFAPQCNQQKHIAESIRDRLYPGMDVAHLPVVYREHRCEWYR